MSHKPIQSKFNKFPWIKNAKNLSLWHNGKTGIPIVDAGMRQLYKTGWMHNRVRMIVGSFLTKNLLLHWKNGEEWFFDTLVDADVGSNSAGCNGSLVVVLMQVHILEFLIQYCRVKNLIQMVIM